MCARCSGEHPTLPSTASTLTSIVPRVTIPCPPPPDPLLGSTVGADYVLRELVGRGGMGRVYRAEQARLGRDVAVKLLHPHLLGDERSLARFYIEARAASRLNHPNSVGVIDFGLDPGGAPYLVMEFLRGQHLRSLLRQSGPLPTRTAIRITLEVLSALSEAHACGVVHRDLKPENIFLVPRREGGHHVKVVDFGLARLTEPGSCQQSQPGWTGGTPGYTAPEQWLGERVDGRTDLYALGVVLFEMLAGRPPFKGETAHLLKAHLSETPPLLSAVATTQRISPVLDELVRQALEKRPEDRFGSAESMATALRDALDGVDGPVSQGLRCNSCSAPVLHGNRFCGDCGTPRFTLSPEIAATQPSPTHAEQSLPLALLLELEQQARSSRRDDLEATISAGRRGLAAARKAFLDTGDDLFEQAVVSFSCKLGDALARAGRLAEAEGVLREVLAHGMASSAMRARMLLSLGRIAVGRGSRERAKGCYGEALGALSRDPDFSLAADIHEAYAVACREGGEVDEAVRALQAACDALGRLPDAGARRAGALLSLGSLLVEAGKPHQALVGLGAALDAALSEGMTALASTCRLTLGDLHARLGPASAGASGRRPVARDRRELPPPRLAPAVPLRPRSETLPLSAAERGDARGTIDRRRSSSVASYPPISGSSGGLMPVPWREIMKESENWWHE